jgi:DNA modification methylase
MPERTNPQVTVIPIDLVHAWKDNPRQVKKGDYDRLKKQILELGFYKALLATPDLEAPGHYIVLGGNTRLRALKELGWTEIGLTIVAAPTEAMRLKYNLSDNDEVGSWDDQALAEIAFRTKDQLQNLDIFKVQIGAPVAVGRLMDSFGPSAASDEDQVPAPQAIPITRPGDLFTLGKHKLLCGDATNPQDYARLLEGKAADLIFSDPSNHPAYSPIAASEEAFLQFAEAFWQRFAESLKPGGAYYVCSGVLAVPVFLYALKKNGLVLAGVLIWTQPVGAKSWRDYRPQYRMALRGARRSKVTTLVEYGWKDGRHYFADTLEDVDLWDGSHALRPGQMPLSLIQRAIKNSSRPGELVLDPFAGSGSTLIAADREGRQARLMELEPACCDVIIRRWAAQGQQTEAEIRAGVFTLASGRAKAGRTPRGQGKDKAQAEIAPHRGK